MSKSLGKVSKSADIFRDCRVQRTEYFGDKLLFLEHLKTRNAIFIHILIAFVELYLAMCNNF